MTVRSLYPIVPPVPLFQRHICSRAAVHRTVRPTPPTVLNVVFDVESNDVIRICDMFVEPCQTRSNHVFGHKPYVFERCTFSDHMCSMQNLMLVYVVESHFMSSLYFFCKIEKTAALFITQHKTGHSDGKSQEKSSGETIFGVPFILFEIVAKNQKADVLDVKNGLSQPARNIWPADDTGQLGACVGTSAPKVSPAAAQ